MIIGISGKSKSGKDTVGKIIQYLTEVHPHWKKYEYDEFCNNPNPNSKWKIHKFADPLKDIVCILTGCTREQLEDEEFKNSKLPDEWNIVNVCESTTGSERMISEFIADRKDAVIPYLTSFREISNNIYKLDYLNRLKTLTYRELLQCIGTDLFRNQLHEDTWVNAVFSKYKDTRWISKAEWDVQKGLPYNPDNNKPIYPNWIITDVRFPNEAKAIKDRGGILIRVNRIASCPNCGNRTNNSTTGTAWKCGECASYFKESNHSSETALDDYTFDYIIDNNSTLEDLIEQVKHILIKEKII